jgi:hypothetical protein
VKEETMLKNKKMMKKIIYLILITFIFSLLSCLAGLSAEKIELEIAGNTDAVNRIDLIRFNDVLNSDTWAKEAIFEVSAMGYINGTGNNRFGLGNNVTNEQVLAVLYRMVGKEDEAQAAGMALNQARVQADRETKVLPIWSDGYLQLALNEGLISQQEYNDVFQTAPEDLLPESFYRGAYATRERTAFWLGKILNLAPDNENQTIIQGLKDYIEITPEYFETINSVVNNKLMNGTTSGYFNPKASIKREEIAQIIKNSQSVLFPALNYTRYLGTIESISYTEDNSTDKESLKKRIRIRTSDGLLHEMVLDDIKTDTDLEKNEQSGNPVQDETYEVIVYKNDDIGLSDVLEIGDRIYYTVDADKSIKFIQYISNNKETKYIGVKINSIDETGNTIDVVKMFEMNYPPGDNLPGNFDFSMNSDDNTIYKLKKDVYVTEKGKPTDIKSINFSSAAILTVLNNDVVSKLEIIEYIMNENQKYIKTGIVEEINTALGYLTLYNESGEKNSVDENSGFPAYRTYTFYRSDLIETYKDGKKAELGDIEAGDSVFIKIDDNGELVSISAASNYITKTCRIIRKTDSILIVEYDNNTSQLLDLNDNIRVFLNDKRIDLEDIKDGDYAKLLLNITERETTIKKITIEGEEHKIESIYKGIFTDINDINETITILSLKKLSGTSWQKTNQKGFVSFRMNEDIEKYKDGVLVDEDDLEGVENEVYFITIKNHGDEEEVLRILFRDEEATETVYSDRLSGIKTGINQFGLENNFNKIFFDNTTLMIKHDRLVTGGSLLDSDNAVVVSNRDYDSGEFFAGIIKIDDATQNSILRIYRGRIEEIVENEKVTLESFSELNITDWDYTNTPKSLLLQDSTRLINEDGVLNLRDFKGYGDNSYLESVVYIAAADSDAELISFAPYSDYFIRGEVNSMEVTQSPTEDEEETIFETIGINLWKAKEYDRANRIWSDINNIDLLTREDTIIIKGDNIIPIDDIKKGDTVRVLKKDDDTDFEMYIIIVE